jgi:hypothetical protein
MGSTTGRLEYIDLGSTYGSFLNGPNPVIKCELTPGDVINVGKHGTIRVIRRVSHSNNQVNSSPSEQASTKDDKKEPSEPGSDKEKKKSKKKGSDKEKGCIIS